MTRDEILKLEAGREMDALVFTHVLKHHVFVPGFHNNAMCDVCGWGTPAAGHPEPKPYSTDDNAAAWEMVQEVYNRGLHREYLHGLYAQGIVDLHLMVHHSLDIDCRAALLAVMEPQP